MGAGLASVGIPKSSVIEYEIALKTDKFLLIVHGTQEEVLKVRAVPGDDGYHASHTVHDGRVLSR